MDTKVIKFIVAVSILVIVVFEAKIYINANSLKGEVEVSEEEINTEINQSEGVFREIDLSFQETESDENVIINSTLDEILNRAEKAQNQDRVGNVNGQEIYVLKCPELTTKSIFHSNVKVPVLYDDYVCVKYDAERENEQYLMLVYYFNADDMWEGWYKYFIADSIKEAQNLAQVEEERGYSVWTYENIVLEGESFSEVSISKEEFLNSFLEQFDDVVYMN